MVMQVWIQIAMMMVMVSIIVYVDRLVVIIVAIKTIDTFRSFEIPFTWIGWIGQEKLGSPIDTLSVIMYKMMIFPIYEFPISYVATISLTLLVISLIVTAVILRVGRILWETT